MRTRDTHSTNFSSDKGFTLVELMVVLAVVGVLLLGAYGLFNRSIQNENLRQCNENKETISQAIMRAAAIDGKALTNINNAAVSRYIVGGIAALKCQVKTNPRSTYTVISGAISPAHNH